MFPRLDVSFDKENVWPGSLRRMRRMRGATALTCTACLRLRRWSSVRWQCAHDQLRQQMYKRNIPSRPYGAAQTACRVGFCTSSQPTSQRTATLQAEPASRQTVPNARRRSDGVVFFGSGPTAKPKAGETVGEAHHQPMGIE